jgi:hypothetical protein
MILCVASWESTERNSTALRSIDVMRLVKALTVVVALAVVAICVLGGCKRTVASDPTESPFTVDPSESTVKTADPSEDPNYWTDERMRRASPAPMPKGAASIAVRWRL